MRHQTDNPIFRFKAAWWGLAMLLLFAVLGFVAWIFLPAPPPTLEELAAASRYAIRAEIDAEQNANLEWKEIEPGQTVKAPPDEVFGLVAKELLAEKPVAAPVAPAAEPEAGEPEAGEPEAGEPETGEPEAGGPEAGGPEAGEPEAGEPEGQPEASDSVETSSLASPAHSGAIAS